MSLSSILPRTSFAKVLMMTTAMTAVFVSPINAANRLSNGVEIIGDEETGITLIYGKEFFDQYPSAVTAVDIIERIPGGRGVLDSGGGGNQSRGFSNNQDGILINGRRLTGKGNDSRSALARITLDQVEKVELIRGNSPDIKTAGQSAVINVVTKADASTSSGTYRLAIVSTDEGHVTPGATLTYGGSANKLEYFLSADLKSESRDPVQRDRFYDAEGNLTRELDFDIDNRRNDKKLSANLSYMLENGNPIRLNAGYSVEPLNHYRYGIDREVDANGDLVQVGETFRKEIMKKPNWEVGGDYAADISDNWSFKVIALYAERGYSFDQSEDYDWDGENFHQDIDSQFDRDSTESIGRLSFKYGGFTGHDVEVGSELAINTMDANLVYLERDDNDQLVNIDVDGAIVGVEEQRLESFLNDTWSFTSKTTVEGAINTEYSKISVDQNPNADRTLFYVKPTLDIRHNLDSQNQIQVTFIRQVSQLDFGSFATKVNGDDQVDGGNNQLNPWKAWKSNWGFEHRLSDDGGSVSATIFTGHFQDMHGPSEVSPGVTGTANIGKAEEYGLKFKASLRLDKIGMENAVLALNGHVGRARVTNDFTGKKETAPWLPEQNVRLNLRHDITEWGVSYELNAFYNVNNASWRYGEYSYPVSPNFNFWGSIQKQLNDSMYVRFGAGPALENNDGRTRVLYAAGIAEGTVTSKEVRKRFNGRRVRFSIHGTF